MAKKELSFFGEKLAEQGLKILSTEFQNSKRLREALRKIYPLALEICKITEEIFPALSAQKTLFLRIPETALSTASKNALKYAGIETVEQLVSNSEATLLAKKYFGKGKLKEVRKFLNDHGLDIAMRKDDVESIKAGEE